MLYKVYTGVGGIKYIYHVSPPVRKIIHSLKLVDYLNVQADNPWYNCYLNSNNANLLFYLVFSCQGWVVRFGRFKLSVSPDVQWKATDEIPVMCLKSRDLHQPYGRQPGTKTKVNESASDCETTVSHCRISKNPLRQMLWSEGKYVGSNYWKPEFRKRAADYFVCRVACCVFVLARETISNRMESGPEAIKCFIMLKSTEHEIHHVHTL